MSVEMVLILLAGVLVVGGVVAGVAIVHRAPPSTGALEADALNARVTCEVHAGEEQLLIRLARELALPSGRDAVGYGEVYLAGSAGNTIRLATRSEIGRGFDAEIRVRRTARCSVAEYFVLSLPADEQVLQRIVALDDEVVRVARELDPQAHVRRTGATRVPRRGMEPTPG